MPSRIFRICLAVVIVAFGLSLFFQTAFFTFPQLILPWTGVFLIVLGLVVIARHDSAKKPEQEAAISA